MVAAAMKSLLLLASAGLACGSKILSNETYFSSASKGDGSCILGPVSQLTLPQESFSLLVQFSVSQVGAEENILRWDSTVNHRGPWDNDLSRKTHHCTVLRVDGDGKLCYGEYDGWTWMRVRDFQITSESSYRVRVTRNQGHVQMELEGAETNNEVKCMGSVDQLQTDNTFRSLWKAGGTSGPVAKTLPDKISNVNSTSPHVTLTTVKVSPGAIPLAFNACDPKGYTMMGAGSCADANDKEYEAWSGPVPQQGAADVGECAKLCNRFTNCVGFDYTPNWGATTHNCEVRFSEGFIPSEWPATETGYTMYGPWTEDSWGLVGRGEVANVKITGQEPERTCYKKDSYFSVVGFCKPTWNWGYRCQQPDYGARFTLLHWEVKSTNQCQSLCEEQKQTACCQYRAGSCYMYRGMGMWYVGIARGGHPTYGATSCESP